MSLAHPHISQSIKSSDSSRTPVPDLDKHRQSALHRQREAALAPPLSALVRGHEIEGPHDGGDDLDGDELGHLLPEAGAGAAIEDGELVGGPR